MLRIPENFDKTTISVFLKNGESYINMDITSHPFGDNENIVCFWINATTIVTFPIEQVARVEMKFPEG